jgi:hypothetical protein
VERRSNVDGAGGTQVQYLDFRHSYVARVIGAQKRG